MTNQMLWKIKYFFRLVKIDLKKDFLGAHLSKKKKEKVKEDVKEFKEALVEQAEEANMDLVSSENGLKSSSTCFLINLGMKSDKKKFVAHITAKRYWKQAELLMKGTVGKFAGSRMSGLFGGKAGSEAYFDEHFFEKKILAS